MFTFLNIIGIVTTTRVTHATPACGYAHSVDRKHECDAKLKQDLKQTCPSYKDIARQLVEDDPGRSLNVTFYLINLCYIFLTIF